MTSSILSIYFFWFGCLRFYSPNLLIPVSTYCYFFNFICLFCAFQINLSTNLKATNLNPNLDIFCVSTKQCLERRVKEKYSTLSHDHIFENTDCHRLCFAYTKCAGMTVSILQTFEKCPQVLSDIQSNYSQIDGFKENMMKYAQSMVKIIQTEWNVKCIHNKIIKINQIPKKKNELKQ